MTVGFYSPLPPAKTGVADYSAALLRALRPHGRVEIAPGRCDASLYHLGNNQIHREIYARAISRPGVIVLHDAVLHHFLLGSLDERRYADEFAYNYGEWHRSLARELWRGRAASASDPRYFAYPLLKRAVTTARATIVHNAAAAALARDHCPEARVFEIPHLFETPATAESGDIANFRARLSLSPQTALFGVFGYLREAKRLLTVLRCFEELHSENPRTALLLAGEIASSDLARAIDPYLAKPGVFRLGHLRESEFWTAAAAIDVCVNLRSPSAAETSGIAIRLMGIGKPVILSAGPEISGYPAGSCFPVDAGVAERAELLQYMRIAVGYPGIMRETGRLAAIHIRERHNPELVAGQYWKVLCSSQD